MDPLVHIVTVNMEHERCIKILCTNYRVFGHQVKPTNDHATCLSCIAKDIYEA